MTIFVLVQSGIEDTTLTCMLLYLKCEYDCAVKTSWNIYVTANVQSQLMYKLAS